MSNHQYHFQSQHQVLRDHSQSFQSRISVAQNVFGQIMELNKQRSGLEMFQVHLEQAKVTYLDEHKLFAVVKVAYLEKLEQISKEIVQRMKKIQQKYDKEISHRSMLEKTVELKNGKVVQLQQNLKKSETQNKELLQFMETFTHKFERSEQMRYEAGINSQILQLRRKQIVQSYEKSKKILEDIETQTQFQAQNFIPVPIEERIVPFASQMRNQMRMHNQELQNISQKAHEGSDQEINEEGEFNRLKQAFEKALSGATTQMNDKIKKLKDENLKIQEWEEQNQRIKLQNEELRKQLKIINEKEEKLNIWKVMMGDFINKVDEEVEVPNKLPLPYQTLLINNPSELATFACEEKIEVLEDSLLKFEAEKLEREEMLKELKEIMQQNEEMPEQNIINTLIVLSSKVKACVQYLLEKCA